MATTIADTELERRTAAWAERSDISARSALVTILGDTVAPLGGTVWLSDLFALSEPFGFSERLVRTSMSRLVTERWVVNERVGRRSRYSLTPFARDEFLEADARIYRPAAASWDGLWTLVFLPDTGSGELARHLGWRGFAQVDRNTWAMPNNDVAGTRQLFGRLGVEPPPPVATAEFDEAVPFTEGPFRSSSGLAEAEDAYRGFVERYGWAEAVADLDPRAAFALRTMVVHDLRRARLRDPQLPAALLPPDWVGHRALALAGSIYRAVAEASWHFATEVTGLTIDPTDPRLARRFADAA